MPFPLARRQKDPGRLEPYILRLQLELPLTRRQAEACARAGFLSHAEIAAVDDDDIFRRAVDLPEEQARAVLALARAPGSKAPQAGPAPQLARERTAGEVVARAVRPVRERAAKLARRAEGSPLQPPSRKPADTPERRRRRAEGDALEADLDEALSKDP